MRSERFTPPHIIRRLGEFDLDPACGDLCPNRTARRRFTPIQNGLTRKWTGRVWLNPPFENCKPWVERMVAHNNGILLIFTKPQADWYRRAVSKAGYVFLFNDNVRFRRPDGSTHHLQFGISLIPFGPRNVQAIKDSDFIGTLLQVVTTKLKNANHESTD
jgi:hypothetical protein